MWSCFSLFKFINFATQMIMCCHLLIGIITAFNISELKNNLSCHQSIFNLFIYG